MCAVKSPHDGTKVKCSTCSFDGITPLSGNLYLHCGQLFRHGSPVIRCDAVILCWCRRCDAVIYFWCQRCVFAKAPRCYVLCVYVEPWPGTRLVSSLIADEPLLMTRMQRHQGEHLSLFV